MKKLAQLLACILFVSIGAAAQTAETSPTLHVTRTQVLADVALDADNNLGYRPPTLFGGLALEYPIGNRFEAQIQIRGGWTRKYITNNGVSLTSRAQGIFWVSDRVGITGALGTSNLWTSQFVKVLNVGLLLRGIQQQELYPLAGLVLRDSFYGAGGRLYVDYKFPTGCQWATASNPCAIQSSRLQGVEIYQEFRMTRYMRFGGSFAVYHGLEQSNQNEPQIPRIGFWAPTAGLTVRFQFPLHDWAEAY